MKRMDTLGKLRVLGAAARHDASCAAGALKSRSGQGKSPAFPGIYISWTDDGRRVPLLKVLYTNRCAYDCAYCANRASADVPRVSFTPRELADLAAALHRRGSIAGLFLSSAVHRGPDHTMREMIEALRLLRQEKGFTDYVHVKALPGADPALVREAALLADRVSVNIELPSPESLRFLAPQKDRRSLLGPMRELAAGIAEYRMEIREDRGRGPRRHPFAPAGQSTQLIVGASPDSDLCILRLTEGLYRRYGLRRVYYSAYVRVNDDPRLPPLTAPPLLRERRLYQADWLLRRYGFRADELLDEGSPFLDEELDPKAAWALRNLHLFPVEVNAAERHVLLRVPGIGARTAERILEARRCHSLGFEDLAGVGVDMKRARHFVTCRGRCLHSREPSPEELRRDLRTAFADSEESEGAQLSLWGNTRWPARDADAASCLTGEM